MNNSRNHSRQPKGTPSGGQFAASSRGEVSILLADAEQKAQALAQDRESDQAQIDAYRALAQRLEAYDRLKDYPAGATVSTIVWPEEPNDDGTFDVDFDTVCQADGVVIDTIGGEGASPAGWYREDHLRTYGTAYDAWREDAYHPDTPILVDRMHQWFHAYRANKAIEAMADPATDADYTGSGWGTHRPTQPVESIHHLAVGDLLAEESTQFAARNLVRVTRVDTNRGIMHGHFVDPADPTTRRLADDQEFARWESDLDGLYRTS